MSTPIYPLHRAINRPMTFKGLKGQYILLAAAGMVADLLLFIILYCCHIPSWICIGIALGLGAGVLAVNTRMSRIYGVHGLRKKKARRSVPNAIRWNSRRIFTQLNIPYATIQ